MAITTGAGAALWLCQLLTVVHATSLESPLYQKWDDGARLFRNH